MPDYTVTHPTTGKTLTISGDAPPSEQDLNQIFAASGAPQEPKESTAYSALAEVPRVASEAVSGVLSSALRAGKGLLGAGRTAYGLATGEGLDKSLQAGSDVIGKRDNVPSLLDPSKSGQFIGQHVVQPVVGELGKAVGSPELAQTLVEGAGDIASLYGLKGVGGLGKSALKSVAETSLPEKIYSSVSKMPTSKAWTRTLGEEAMSKRNAAIAAGLEGEVPVSEFGIAKAKSLELAHRIAVDDAVNQLDTTGTLIPKSQLKAGLQKAYETAGYEGDAATKFVDSLYDKKFANKGELLPNGERVYKPSEIQDIKQHLYKQANYESTKLSRGVASQLRELGTKGMAREAKLALEDLNPELKALNAKDAAYINLTEALEKAVGRMGNKDLVGLGTKVLMSGGNPLKALADHLVGLATVKGRLAFALNRARKLQTQPLGKSALQAGAGLAGSVTQQPQQDQGFQEGGTIDGPIKRERGDNVLVPSTEGGEIPMETGEYVTPVDALIAKGREMAPEVDLSDEHAHALGKSFYDQETARLKQLAGNDTPPNNS